MHCSCIMKKWSVQIHFVLCLQRRVNVFEKEEKKKRKEEKKVTSADCNTNFTDYTCISIISLNLYFVFVFTIQLYLYLS